MATEEELDKRADGIFAFLDNLVPQSLAMDLAKQMKKEGPPEYIELLASDSLNVLAHLLNSAVTNLQNRQPEEATHVISDLMIEMDALGYLIHDYRREQQDTRTAEAIEILNKYNDDESEDDDD